MIKYLLVVSQDSSGLGYDTQWSVFMPGKLFKYNHTKSSSQSSSHLQREQKDKC